VSEGAWRAPGAGRDDPEIVVRFTARRGLSPERVDDASTVRGKTQIVSAILLERFHVGEADGTLFALFAPSGGRRQSRREEEQTDEKRRRSAASSRDSKRVVRCRRNHSGYFDAGAAPLGFA
jgi:hypothetical protein